MLLGDARGLGRRGGGTKACTCDRSCVDVALLQPWCSFCLKSSSAKFSLHSVE